MLESRDKVLNGYSNQQRFQINIWSRLDYRIQFLKGKSLIIKGSLRGNQIADNRLSIELKVPDEQTIQHTVA